MSESDPQPEDRRPRDASEAKATASENTGSEAAQPEPPAGGWESVQAEHAARESAAKKTLRIALGVALALHLAFLAWHFPKLTEADPPPEEEKPEVFKVQQVEFKPPPPPPEPKPEPEPEPEPEAEEIPMPDPEPEEPEPEPEPEPAPEPLPTPDREVEFVEETEPVELPTETEVDLPETDMELAIPEGPPEKEPEGPIRVGGDVKAPVKVSGREPGYTPSARNARVEGPVVVQAIVDKQGNVTDVKVLKEQPMGLSEQATEAIAGWKFKPATLNGKPVDVYYNLTVNFNLD